MTEPYYADTAEKDALYALWREAAAKGITEGVDWPRIALHLFRDLDDALAFKNAVMADRARETARSRPIPSASTEESA